MRPAVLRLEQLESRDCAAALAYASIVQGNAADCTFLALLAVAASQGVDLQSRLHHVRPHVWTVDLHRTNGVPATVTVRDDRLTPLDPEVIRGDRRPVLFARANRKIFPFVTTGGQSAEVAGVILFGRGPDVERSVRAVGLEAIKAALERGSAVICYSAYHAYAILSINARTAVLWDPWGQVRRVPTMAFLRKPFDVAVFRPEED